MSTQSGLRPKSISIMLALALGLGVLVSACDTAVSESPSPFVVEAFVQEGTILPQVRVSQMAGPATGRSAALQGLPDAVVTVTIGDAIHAYHHLGGGRYASILPADAPIRAGNRFRVDVQENGVQATGEGIVPPSISLLDVTPRPATKPVEAILVDSLGLSIDSLDVGLGARLGFIIPVEVELAWDDLRNGYWVATHLNPDESFSSSVLDFFLLSEEVVPESGRYGATWKGVYAVPVQDSTTSLPAHELLVSVTRGDSAFAAWMSTRASGLARANAGNVQGAAGFIGGIAVDTLRVRIDN